MFIILLFMITYFVSVNKYRVCKFNVALFFPVIAFKGAGINHISQICNSKHQTSDHLQRKLSRWPFNPHTFREIIAWVQKVSIKSKVLFYRPGFSCFVLRESFYALF